MPPRRDWTTSARTRLPAALVLLVTIGVGWNVASSRGDRPESPLASPTNDIALLEPTSTDQPGRTPIRAATIPPTDIPATVAPTSSPTVAPTEPPAATERPAVPDNATGQAIIVDGTFVDRRQVAFSFDCGEGRGYTEQVLDLLDTYGVKGNFGVTGEFVAENPDLVERMVRDGHQVFNHTQSHGSWTGASPGTAPLTDEQRTADLLRPQQAVEELTGYDMRPFFRPPFGDYDADALTLLSDNGYGYLLWWTCDSGAWEGIFAADIVAHCAPDNPDAGGPGYIILMHPAQEQDYLALPDLLQAYLDAGIEVVTFDQYVQP